MAADRPGRGPGDRAGRGVRCGRLRLLGVLIVLGAEALGGAALAAPGRYPCANPALLVLSPSAQPDDAICEGADDAVRFFTQIDRRPDGPLVIEVVSELPDGVDSSAAGCYLEDEDRILVVPFSTFRANDTWFGVPIDRRMYRSLVAHEVAHALAACHFDTPRPPIHAKEYIAYVAMFATMTDPLRGEILAANPGSGFDSDLKINTAVYLFDPMRFAVNAYRHYLRRADRTRYLHDVLAGKALAN